MNTLYNSDRPGDKPYTVHDYDSEQDLISSKKADKWLIWIYALLLLAAAGLVVLINHLTELSN